METVSHAAGQAPRISVLHDADISTDALKGKMVCVIGYGIQGRAQSLNWRDSGLDVVVGLREGGKSWKKAQADGMRVKPVKEAATGADVVALLIPDTEHKRVYEESVRQALRPGMTIYVSHGFSVLYGQIVPPANVDVIMVAPKSPGDMVRKTYLDGFGTPALAAVHQDATGTARATALALAKAMGCARAGVFECTFRQETNSDLFGEQAVLCGGSAELIKAGFQTLVDAGYPPEIAYFEVLHELKLITDLTQAHGISGMYDRVSTTAQYGGMTRGKRIIDERARQEMKAILGEIESGAFAKEWISENESGAKNFKALAEKEHSEPIERVGTQIRTLFEQKK